jgi:hypothetical protein
MKRWLMVLAVLLTAFSTARADVIEMTAKIRHSPYNKVFGNWTVKESLIGGHYALYARPSDRPCIMDGAMTAVICDKNWLHMSFLGQGSAFTPDETKERFRAMFEAVRFDQAIPLRYGGGTRRVILVSAYDCPNCKVLEQHIEQVASKLDATIYVFPTALNQGSAPAMQTATDLWCGNEAAQQWRSAMAGVAKPQARAVDAARCGLRLSQNSVALANAFNVKAVPVMIFESGDVVFNGATMPLAALTELLGGAR